MDILTIASVLLMVANISLGLLVYMRTLGQSRGRTFLAFTTTAALWIGGLVLSQQKVADINPDLAATGLKLAFAGAALTILSFVYLTTVYPKKVPFRKAVEYPVLFLGILFALISLSTDKIVLEIKEYLPFGYTVEYGSLYYFYGAYIVIALVVGFWILIQRYKEIKDSDDKKEALQLRYFLGATFLSFLPVVITNLIVPSFLHNSPISRIGPLF
ncbi:MAG: histidine kinase N-terminal 7TM domain-containing protein, partial [Candidatus Spechtbacterales bacterium]|nr:histidine kinase N-terminal 7TM domain-containing protein [Candidatus Spechtbacterales bacterium]